MTVSYRDESGDLVSQTLGGNISDFFDDLLVGVEVESESEVSRGNVSSK
jgi:hypothetical protein